MHRSVVAWALVVLAAPLAAQQPSGPAWPAARGGAHAMAYDARRGLTLLYGDRGADADVLWGWDGATWRAFRAPGPGLRRHIKLAWDPDRDRLVLFGGLDDSGARFMGDTWEWDGTGWARVATDGPSPRASYSMVYDPDTRRVLLFGGFDAAGPRADLWAWDGRRWQELQPGDGPSPRTEAGLVHDPARRGILLSGGSVFERVTAADGSGPTLRIRVIPDNWLLRGGRWERLADQGGTRSFTALVQDPVSGEPLRIGGESDSAFEGDLARWNGAGWQRIDGAEQPGRHGVAAALDTRRRRVVTFGGSAGSRQRSTAVADLREWDGVRWIAIPAPR